MENGIFIDGLPINSIVIFRGKLLNNQMVVQVIGTLKNKSNTLHKINIDPGIYWAWKISFHKN
jgi:hypothetical protein